jgi:Golgi nucleoside diphosphatase
MEQPEVIGIMHFPTVPLNYTLNKLSYRISKKCVKVVVHKTVTKAVLTVNVVYKVLHEKLMVARSGKIYL